MTIRMVDVIDDLIELGKEFRSPSEAEAWTVEWLAKRLEMGRQHAKGLLTQAQQEGQIGIELKSSGKPLAENEAVPYPPYVWQRPVEPHRGPRAVLLRRINLSDF